MVLALLALWAGMVAIGHAWDYLPEVEEQSPSWQRVLPPLEQRVLSSAELSMVSDAERIAYLRTVAYDTNKYVSTRAWALHELKRKYPTEFDKQAQELYDKLLGLIAKEIS
jgi:hypothetical protein